jgi:hypothetical protein
VRTSVASELLKKRRPRLLVDEPFSVERTNVGECRVFSPSEYQTQARVGRECCCAVKLDEADVQAFVETLEETGERAMGQPRGRTTARGSGNSGILPSRSTLAGSAHGAPSPHR